MKNKGWICHQGINISIIMAFHFAVVHFVLDADCRITIHSATTSVILDVLHRTFISRSLLAIHNHYLRLRHV